MLGGLSHIHWLPHYTGLVGGLYAAGKLAALQVTGIAMGVARFERWGASLRRRFTRFVSVAGRAVASRSAWGRLLLDAAAMRRQLDIATTTIAHLRQLEAHYEALAVARGETEQKLEAATATISHLRPIEARYEAMAGDYGEMRRQLEIATSTITHLRRIEAHLEALTAADANARNGVLAFIDELQRILFEVRQTTPQSRSAAVLVLGDQPVDNTIATLVNLSEPAHGARPFQYLLPFLAPSGPFPLPWPGHMPPLRIVDVGSQELDFESDMFAPLRHAAPLNAIGFDPFAPPSGKPTAR